MYCNVKVVLSKYTVNAAVAPYIFHNLRNLKIDNVTDNTGMLH